jgi:outer membrane biosynthesis protein TonB
VNQSQLVLDQVRAMGLILRDARLARDINPRDLETELRTTYRHLLAIEEGQMRLFYSDSFFCDLFTRYAVQLGFSSEQAQDMRLALHGEGPLVAPAITEPEPDSEPKPESSPAAESSSALEPEPEPETKTESERESEPEPESNPAAESSPAAPESDPAPEHDPAPEQEVKQEVQPEPKPTRSSDASQSLGSLWFWGAIAIGLVLAVVILTLEPSPEDSNPVAGQKPQVSVKPTVPEKPSTPPEPAPAATSAEASAATPTSPAATPTSSPATSEAEQQEPVAAPPPEPPKERRVSESILISALDAPASFTTGSAMAIRFNVKGWVWVREFDDNVREFVVQQGQTVRFNELPIFIVVPFPDQHTVTVNNQSVTLRRNDDEKNHARYSRSMLRGLVTNP